MLQSLLGICLPVLVAWGISVLIYRIYFHPLANVPGPLLGRMFHFYSFWYNLNGGRFYLQIPKLHAMYGPVVRITPSEIHLSDPNDCDKVYSVGSNYGKDPSFYDSFGTPKATFTTCDPHVHRVKRAVLNPFFSQKRVSELEEHIQQKVTLLIGRIRQSLAATGEINLQQAFQALAIDVVTDYSFDKCYNFLERPDFGIEFFDMIRSLGPGVWVFNQFPLLQPIALATPLWLAKLTSKSLSKMMIHRLECRRQILHIKEKVENKEPIDRTTIFDQLLRSEIVKNGAVPTVQELEDEAYVILAAAADTTGNALTRAAYHIVRNAQIYATLSKELQTAFPDQNSSMDYKSLKALPYLTGIVKEALRLSSGVPGRLPRIVPCGDAEFHNYHVPEGTIVSMSPWTVNYNDSIFPNPEEFNPSRWIDPVQSKTMDKYLFSFGKGSTQCIGMSLAYSELYIVLGRFFRTFRDLKTRHRSRTELLFNDYFSGFYTEENNDFIFRYMNE
ncbi:cytochrome P450 [Aspergillus lucknowensis]|uniref:Cytochrome P450 n=1 Tax=Aspergillus lucknowensis TaxID=176173 RepID=A0ABR4LHJ6_9EURO